MKLQMLDVDEFVRVNNLPQITNSLLMSSPGEPSPDGLLSYEIFGLPGTVERRENFAYIDIGERFFNPAVYKAVMKKHPLLNQILQGTVAVKITEEGGLVEDPDSEATGIGWLMANFNKIRFDRNESLQRTTELEMIEKAPDSKRFITKIPVIPASYRDMTEQSSTGGQKIGVHDLTNLYNRALNIATQLERFQNDITLGNKTRLRMMHVIFELYQYFLDVLGSKTGFFKAHVMKKTIDYGVNTVIVPMSMDANHPDDQHIKFGEMGVPINQVVTMFKPHMVAGFRNFMVDEIRNIRQLEAALDTEYKLNEFAEGMVQSADYIEDYLKRFIDSPDSRFEPIIPPQVDGEKKPLQFKINDEYTVMTIMDVMYLICYDLVQTNQMLFSRYPIENYQSISISKIKILTTRKTRKATIRSRIFNFYPDFRRYPDPKKQLINVAMVNTAYCPAMNADFDGDTMFLRGLYGSDSNLEAERVRISPQSILDYKGASSRSLGGEGLAALYAITRDS